MAQGKHVCNICGDSVKLRTHIEEEHPSYNIKEYFKEFLDNKGGVCLSCGIETEIDWKNKRFYKTCGKRECLSNRFKITSKEFQTKRWKEDEEYREKMRSVSSFTMKKLMSDPNFGGHNFTFTSDKLKEKWEDPEYRNSQSLRAYEQNKNQDSDFGKPFSGWCKYKGVNFRSSWERDFAEQMDEASIEWVYEPRSFSYTSYEGILSNYLVDFYLPDLEVYVEIKAPYYLDNNTELKLQAVKDEGYKIMFFDENNYDIITKRN